MRAHFRAPIQDQQGDLLPGAVVSVYQNGTTTLISNPVWADGTSSNQLGNPFISPDGNCNFYLDAPQRVDLSISAPGQIPYSVLDVDVNAAGATSVTLTFPGTGAHTTQVGANAKANQPQASAFGDSSSATGATSTALGQNAQATASGSLAVGQGALATGTQSVAVGDSIASGTQSTAIGQAALAGATGSTALGSNASAQGIDSTAIGINAVASAPHQVVLGTAAETVVIPGALSFSPGGQVVTNLVPSNDTTGTTDTANVNAAISSFGSGGGLVILAPGKFYWIGNQVIASSPGVSIRGSGRNSTYVYGVASGDVFRMFWAGTYSDGTTQGGGITGLTLDGSNMTSSIAYTATNASPAVFTATGSGFVAGQIVTLSGGSPPSGFSNGTLYYAVNPTANTFQLAASSGGTAINSSGTGNGNVLPGSSGLHMGDIAALEVDVLIRSFNAGPASIGAHLDNQYHWTERMRGRIDTSGCYNAVVFDTGNASGAGTSTESFGRTDLTIMVTTNNPNYNGVVLANGALLYDSRLRIAGNFGSGSSALSANPYAPSYSPAVLTMSGRDRSNNPSKINTSQLLIQVEAGAGAFPPQTIVSNIADGNAIRSCTGVLDFQGSPTLFTPSNITLPDTSTGNWFWFQGVINGDENLAKASTGITDEAPFVTTAAQFYQQGTTHGTTSVGLATYSGDFFDLGTLANNVTVQFFIGIGNLNFTGGQPQRIRVKATQAASGGPYTIVWPSSGSPSTTSPNVLWPGGVTPVMTTTASAVDYYMFETVDGATWFGYAVQASRAPLIPSTITYTSNASNVAIPFGATLLLVTVIGAGGGGGGSAGSSPTQIGASGGGGGAGVAFQQYVSVSSGNTYSITIAGGGAGGVAGTINQGVAGQTGTAPGFTTFNYNSGAVVLNARGGGGGVGGALATGNGAQGGMYGNPATTSNGGQPGSGAPGGSSNAVGGNGGWGFGFSGGGGGGGGGANAGTANGNGGSPGGAPGITSGVSSGGAAGGGGTQTGGNAAANSGAGGGGAGGTATVPTTGAVGATGGNGGSGQISVQVVG